MRRHPYGVHLLRLLGERGLTQADLQRRLGEVGVKVTESAVSLWCSGKTLPTSRNQVAIADVLSLTAEQRLAAMRAAAAPRAEPQAGEAA